MEASSVRSSGVLRDLPARIDSNNVSPRNRSPLPSSPPPAPRVGGSGSSGPKFASPLREERTVADILDPPKLDLASLPSVANGSPVATPVSVKSLRDEFPFDAPAGSLAHPPTTNIIRARDHAAVIDEASDIATEMTGVPLASPSRRGTTEGSATPPGRRSVQFARGESQSANHSRHPSLGTGEEEHNAREKDGSRLMSRLKAIATPSFRTHSRTASMNAPLSPEHEREHRLETLDDADADAEETADEFALQGLTQTKKRRRFRKQTDDTNSTAPTTPRRTRRPSYSDLTPAAGSNRAAPFRQATTDDVAEDQRAGYSEDEGRARMANAGMFRRGSAWVERHSHSHRPGADDGGALQKRPTGLRRLTALASESFGQEGSPERRRGDRTQTLSAQKWRQLKASMRLLTSKNVRQPRLGNAKSAELMAELLAGAPAALFLASMFQRDEQGHKRVPVLLEQLKIRVLTAPPLDPKEDKNVPIKVELEYGSSLARMTWTIERTVNDFFQLHTKYRVQAATQKYVQLRRDHERSRQPKFPKRAFPWLEKLSGNKDEQDEMEEEDLTAGEQSAVENEPAGMSRPGLGGKRRTSIGFLRKKSSFFGPSGLTDGHGRAGSITARNERFQREQYADWQRKQVEIYLNKMITWVMFRPESNRMCRFLELSALGVRLAAEGGYHGKEGYLSIHKMTGLDKRRGIRPSIFRRGGPEKWFLVRHSYIVCVDSPEEMNIYDVFLVDYSFSCTKKSDKRLRDENAQDLAKRANEKISTHHRMKIENSERSMKLATHDAKMLVQFEKSIEHMASQTPWAQRHRYDSFAPVRQNVSAQFLVDGRDYMWNVSRAISMARDVIYIHDWWLSPEIYLRRPAAISQRWRLDRLLKRKAEEGVKIYVIVYRNVDSAIPIDSEYTKFSLLDLHENIYVQRSPNQMRQATFFWSHHEKICVVDHAVAFCGGVDLCFGRWDTPGHPLTDSHGTGFEINDLPKDADHCQLWPGKDYSNPRVQDFYSLDKPYEEMYDRDNIPRMPWHDIGMQIVGQPARDLSRHFIQRWNYVLRQRTPTRPTPMLLPPPDFLPAELEALGLNGTCEIQILRSAGNWSLGTPKTECSIMNAYVDTIRNSEHFVYIENQFFITTLHNSRTRILNKIGDALVERIIRADENGEDWRCIIIIPLVPGYQNTVDQAEGSSVRLIMQCQWWSICRGETSIFGRLRAHGIDPEDYIEFSSLRSWGRIGPNNALVTEQLYIHAKIMIVDDRIAIIGSANINERSLLGNRDSEIAAIVRDTDLRPSFMKGKPYMVGRFAHDMRMRLMREHLGLDVDAIREEEENDDWDRLQDKQDKASLISSMLSRSSTDQPRNTRGSLDEEIAARQEGLRSFNHDNDWEQANNPNMKVNKAKTKDARVTANKKHQEDVAGEGADHMNEHLKRTDDGHARDTVIDRFGREVLVETAVTEGRGTLGNPETPQDSTKPIRKRGSKKSKDASKMEVDAAKMPPAPVRMDTYSLGLPYLSTLPSLPVLDDTDIGGPPLMRSPSGRGTDLSDLASNPLLADIFAKGRPNITKDCMRDPLNPSFYHNIWMAVAQNNTRLFRSVFKCMPDNEVSTWSDYKEFAALSERFAQSQGLSKSKQRAEQESKGTSGPPGFNANINGPASLAKAMGQEAGHVSGAVIEKLAPNHGDNGAAVDPSEKHKKPTSAPQGTVEDWAKEQEETGTVAGSGIDEKTAYKAELNASAMNGGTEPPAPAGRMRNVTISEPAGINSSTAENVTTTRTRGSTNTSGVTAAGSVRRKRAATARSRFQGAEEILSKDDAEMALEQIQGALVVFPYDWLEKEEQGNGTWMWHVDNVAPLEIFT